MFLGVKGTRTGGVATPTQHTTVNRHKSIESFVTTSSTVVVSINNNGATGIHTLVNVAINQIEPYIFFYNFSLIFTIRAESLQTRFKKEPDKLSTKYKSKNIKNQRPTKNISYNPIAEQKWTRNLL